MLVTVFSPTILGSFGYDVNHRLWTLFIPEVFSVHGFHPIHRARTLSHSQTYWQRISTGAEPAWQSVGTKVECDTAAGEVYMKQSSSKVSDLDACQASCQNAAGCESITFYKSGWCSHYSTPCTTTKRNKKAAVALRLGADSRNLRG